MGESDAGYWRPKPSPKPQPEPQPQPEPPSPKRPDPPKPPAPPAVVTADTPFRDVGDLSAETWRAVLTPLRSPILAELDACVRACAPHGALGLAQAVKESSGGTAGGGAAKKNALGLMLPDGSTLQTFPSWVAGFAEFVRRRVDRGYKGGIYFRPEFQALAGYVRLYVAGPGPGYANGETPESVALYLRQTVERVNAWRGAKPAPTPPPEPKPGAVVFGRVPRPPIVPQIIDKPAGWADYGPRDLLLAIVLHNVIGNASTTGAYFARYDPAYANGGHGWNALTDWGVCNANDGPAWDGKILKWNDPDGRRSPFASGGYAPPHGDGAAYAALCRKLGYDINRASEAIEISRLRNGDPVSAVCMDAIVGLAAYRVDVKGRVRWDTWPRNNHGVQMILTHDEMGKKECNALDVVPEAIERVRDTLERWQTGRAGRA